MCPNVEDFARDINLHKKGPSPPQVVCSIILEKETLFFLLCLVQMLSTQYSAYENGDVLFHQHTSRLSPF